MQNYIGQQIDRYRITERLGMGGMAVVYKAFDTRLERDVALKLIRVDEVPASQHERLMKRFEREAKAQASFSHRNIVPVYDYGEVDGSPYLVMAFISSGTLKDRLHGPVDWRQAVRWLIPVAEALAYAHQRGIVHRDVKPANILFDEGGLPILTDFGIAKVLKTDEATLTGTGMVVGTPEYMAPEQWQGKTSPATDQYALGVVLYELITVRKPYTADTPAAIFLMQATEPLQAPSKIVSGIPESVEKALYKALARNPENRYEDMAAFQTALEGLLLDGETQGAEKPAQPEQQRKLASAVVDVVSSEGETRDVLDTTQVEEIRTTDRTAKPTLGIGSTRINPIDGAEMVYVPAGEFLMGSEDPAARDYESPEHTVYLDDYWIYKHEVTNEQYAVFLNAMGNQAEGGVTWLDAGNKNARIHERNGDWEPDEGYEDHPVIEVSWYGAAAYCQWAGGRLPTEAEWEKAARGTDGRTYPWGEKRPNCNLAQFWGCPFWGCPGDTVPVGSFPAGASPYGGLDMAGNVWEWVADWYDADYYQNSPSQNPTGPASGTYRVLRGGSWFSIERSLRASNRLRYSPDFSFHNYGFRCLSSP